MWPFFIHSAVSELLIDFLKGPLPQDGSYVPVAADTDSLL